MSDTEPTDREADRLRELLHRAAEGLDVTTPTLDTALQQHRPRRRGSGRWLAAASVLVVAAVGALLWWDSPEERVETVPASPEVTVAPQVLEQSEIWRLPEDLDGYRVVSAMTSSSVRALLIAVDDVDEPTRWLSLADHGVEIPLDGSTRVIELASGLELLLRPVEGEEGVTRFGLRVGSSSAYVTGTFHGVEEEVVDLLAATFDDVEAFEDFERRTEALGRLRPPGGLTPIWDPGDASYDPRGVTVLTLVDDDGPEVAVTLERTELPPAVAALRMRLVMRDLATIGGPGGSSVTQEFQPRPDLGAHVLQLRARIDGQPAGAAANQIVVITADGTVISVTRVARQDEILTTEPLDEEAQLRIVNSLRAMSAEEFRAAVEAAGAELVDPDAAAGPNGVPTTAHSGPASTTTVP